MLKTGLWVFVTGKSSDALGERSQEGVQERTVREVAAEGSCPGGKAAPEDERWGAFATSGWPRRAS